jgi:pimeloyl-ACP methyl ester carboxylesterase
MLLSSRHLPLLLFQFVSPPLAQIEPGTPTDWRPVDQTIKADISVDVREYAARIKAPTLLVIAKHDQIVPPAYSENLVPDAKTVELNSGHLIFLEKPVELASAILSFCQWQADAVS